jgi:uncharacterized membrane protein
LLIEWYAHKGNQNGDNMNLSFTYFIYTIFFISLFLTYGFGYLVAYKLFKLHKEFKEPNLALILLGISIVISPLLFSLLFDIASDFILCWYKI